MIHKAVMTNAWAMYKTGNAKSFKEALKLSWIKFKLLKSMSENKVEFSYFKISTGDERIATGTIDNPYSDKNMSYPNLVTYWDVDKNNFRSFYIDNLTSINKAA